MQSKAVYRHLPIPLRLPRQVPHLHRQPPAIRVYALIPSSSGSYDSEGDELLKEFQQYADPNRLQKVTKRLELTWSVDRVRVLCILLVLCSSGPYWKSKLHLTLVFCCRGVNLHRVTAVMGQARKNVHGAEAQVLRT